MLCPGAGRGSNATQTTAPGAMAGRPQAPATPQPAQRVPTAEYAVGQAVQARYGGAWIKARVNKVTQLTGPRGPQVAYDVSLENGKRGIVPSRMLRPS